VGLPRAGEAPAIDISSDGTFAAVVYKKPLPSNIIYIKSATFGSGWVTVTELGTGASPQLAFSRAMNNRVYVVWVSEDATTIKLARCTLAVSVEPQCTSDNVHSSGGDVLATPDITVGLNSSGQDVVHLAWTNESQNWIRTALSGTIRVVDPPISPPVDTTVYNSPVLAWSNPVHLAFLSKKSGENNHNVEYRRSDNDETDHSWGQDRTFAKDNSYNAVYEDIGRPAIAAAGNVVYLAWAADKQVDAKGPFGLMRVTSITTGTDWPAKPLHITSDLEADSVPEPGDDKNSVSLSPPSDTPEENGLRPSLAISGTNDLAIVWQQFPHSNCNQAPIGSFWNETSEIYLAYTNTTWLSYTLAMTNVEYSIAPDIAVGPDGQEHIVFMKGSAKSGCGSPDEYHIYYRGPFEDTGLDRGECCGVFVPVILKNGS
jgi:hypothetical protein